MQTLANARERSEREIVGSATTGGKEKLKKEKQIRTLAAITSLFTVELRVRFSAKATRSDRQIHPFRLLARKYLISRRATINFRPPTPNPFSPTYRPLPSRRVLKSLSCSLLFSISQRRALLCSLRNKLRATLVVGLRSRVRRYPFGADAGLGCLGGNFDACTR